MKLYTRVVWITASGIQGSGLTITAELDGHVQVAVDAENGEEHRVIYCAVTWLTPVV